MSGPNLNRVHLTARVGYWVVTLVFAFYWVVLLIWGYHHWPTLPFHRRALYIGMVSLYPVPWLHMNLDRRVGSIVASLSAYLALQFGVILLSAGR
jgi:hypothetical protein